MSSNIKPKSAAKDAPTEPFKRAVGVCLRAIAGKGDIEVAFAAERPGLAGGKARLPEPPRRLNEGEAAIVRGHADSIALRLACHDPAVHRKLVPGGQQARAVFEAVEQARVEAIGSRRMGGVAKNLTAMLDDRFHRGKYDEITDRADAPLEDAIAMIVRERLTGQTPPATARKLVVFAAMKTVIEHGGKVLRHAAHAARADRLDAGLLDRLKHRARLLAAGREFAMHGGVMAGEPQRDRVGVAAHDGGRPFIEPARRLRQPRLAAGQPGALGGEGDLDVTLAGDRA